MPTMNRIGLTQPAVKKVRGASASTSRGGATHQGMSPAMPMLCAGPDWTRY